MRQSTATWLTICLLSPPSGSLQWPTTAWLTFRWLKSFSESHRLRRIQDAALRRHEVVIMSPILVCVVAAASGVALLLFATPPRLSQPRGCTPLRNLSSSCGRAPSCGCTRSHACSSSRCISPPIRSPPRRAGVPTRSRPDLFLGDHLKAEPTSLPRCLWL